MGMPDPTFAFTIPSLHDSTPLDCRIYHPTTTANVTHTWQRKAAILAPPYAPLGGSFEDPVVQAASAELLDKGWVVGLFNFRGAAMSKGRTSWTGRPEVEDYGSFAGLVALYVGFVRVFVGDDMPTTATAAATATVAGMEDAPRNPKPTHLILGGYSYGSLIASRLPTPAELLKAFTAPAAGSAAAEIVQRARELAARTVTELLDLREIEVQGREDKRGAYAHVHTVMMGGEEGDGREAHRKSREGRRSVDGHGVVGRIWRGGHHRGKSSQSQGRSDQFESPTSANTSNTAPRAPDLGVDVPDITIHPSYLLISPLLPPTSLFILPSFPRFRPVDTPNLLAHPGLAIFGEHDLFTSARKLQVWAARLAEESGGGFEGRMVGGAGHFWQERGAVRALREAVGMWVGRLEGMEG